MLSRYTLHSFILARHCVWAFVKVLNAGEPWPDAASVKWIRSTTLLFKGSRKKALKHVTHHYRWKSSFGWFSGTFFTRLSREIGGLEIVTFSFLFFFPATWLHINLPAFSKYVVIFCILKLMEVQRFVEDANFQEWEMYDMMMIIRSIGGKPFLFRLGPNSISHLHPHPLALGTWSQRLVAEICLYEMECPSNNKRHHE